MELLKLKVPTAVAEPGMSVRELFAECVKADVPGLPFRDSTGKIVAKASIRHVLKENCIPEFMVRHARLLGDHIDTLRLPEIKARRMLELQVDASILADMAVITPASPVAKALAVMEAHETPPTCS
jgi:hypothetical protein